MLTSAALPGAEASPRSAFLLEAGLVNEGSLRFADHEVRARLDSPAAPAMREIHGLEAVVAVFRSHPDYAAPGRIVTAIREIVRHGDIRAFAP